MDLQKLLDNMAEMDRKTRSQYHLTLGQLIEKLRNFSPSSSLDLPVLTDHDFATRDEADQVYFRRMSVFSPHSYRGFYSDLSFVPSPQTFTARELLQMATDSLGKTFEGYKGGDFLMEEKTPLWIASYGSTGLALMDIVLTGDHWTLVTKNVDLW